MTPTFFTRLGSRVLHSAVHIVLCCALRVASCDNVWTRVWLVDEFTCKPGCTCVRTTARATARTHDRTHARTHARNFVDEVC